MWMCSPRIYKMGNDVAELLELPYATIKVNINVYILTNMHDYRSRVQG